MKYIRRVGLVISCMLLSILAQAQPNADFTANVTQGCVPLLVQFNSNGSVQSSSYTHTWNLGGTSSSKANPSKLFTAAGTFTITHTVTGPGGTSTVTKTGMIEVYPKPSVSFSGNPQKGCPPMTVNFTDNSNLNVAGAGTYFWVFTNSAPSTAKNPTNVYNDGPYDVSLTVTNSKGCFETLTKKQYIDVFPTPTVGFTANKTEFCSAPGTVTFTGTATGTTGPYRYEWDFGDLTPKSYLKSPSHTYTGPAPKTYTVKLSVFDSSTGCIKEEIKTNYIRIYKPDASFTAPDSVCIGSEVTFTNTSASGASVHAWNFGDGGSITSPNSTVKHTYNNSGLYTVRLISTYGNACPDTFIKKIYVRPQPDISFYIEPDTLCPAPQTVKFTTYYPMTQYLWDFGDGNTSTAASPSHTYTQNGQYTITLIATNQFGCKDTLTRKGFVKIFPLYINARQNVDSGCVPLSVNFNVDLYRDSGYYYPYPVKSYKWYFGNGDSSVLGSPAYTYTDSGVF
ncbi:MAG: PKD domain-containing protein, partial [Chitinophagaceae bacterium]|nr:PKD domain-containing protein [Chitinophagaceae bacterium]